MQHATSFLLPLYPSRQLSAVLGLAHFFAFACVVFANLPLAAKIFLWLLVAVSHVRARRHELPADYRFFLNGRIEKVGAGDTASAGHCDESTLLGSVMIVHFGEGVAGHFLIVLKDSFAGADDYRRLRLWLKWQAKYYHVG